MYLASLEGKRKENTTIATTKEEIDTSDK